VPVRPRRDDVPSALRRGDRGRDRAATGATSTASDRNDRGNGTAGTTSASSASAVRDRYGNRDDRGQREQRAARPAEGMDRFRIEVGHDDGVKPGNIVGAIANEAGLEGRYIGRIEIRDDYTTLDLPSGMPKEIFQHLKKTRVCGRPLAIKRIGGKPPRDRLIAAGIRLHGQRRKCSGNPGAMRHDRAHEFHTKRIGFC
jgi:ATP-dependent RNA helicase DeaD